MAAVVKVQIPAGKANPAPPVGTALGPHGINIKGFCDEFNDKTREMGDILIPVEVTINDDRTFSFITKTPPAAILIKKALKLKKGSKTPHTEKVGTLSQSQLHEIAETKMPDLNAHDLEAAMKIIAGTARNMGVKVDKS
jgi:large subunit ribosomal protein L11